MQGTAITMGFIIKFADEWERACKRLKKSGYDLSKIKLVQKDGENDNRRA